MAHLKRTEFGKVELDYVLGVGGFDLERLFLYLLFVVWLKNSIVSKLTYVLCWG